MERIICSAIWAKYLKKGHFNPINIQEGFIIAGLRHCNCLETLNAIDRNSGKRQQECEQGFLTSDNRYVNRVSPPSCVNRERSDRYTMPLMSISLPRREEGACGGQGAVCKATQWNTPRHKSGGTLSDATETSKTCKSNLATLASLYEIIHNK